MPGATWIAVLVKEPATAKARLAGILSSEERVRLAEGSAMRALAAALEVAPTLAVCGGPGAARLAEQAGAEAVLESRPDGQNHAARLGLAEVAARGGESCLLLSSDLPLIGAESLRGLLDRAGVIEGPLVVAAPATGRQGTNALYLRPMDGFDLLFGEASLPRFIAEARRRGRPMLIHDDPALALDIDEPEDLEALARARASIGETR